MLKLSSAIIGENYSNVSKFQPSSKRKIKLLATCLIIPVTLWFITGFLTSKITMNHNLPLAITTGLISAFLVYLIERTIILSGGGWIILIFRILLGFIIASLGAVTLDIAIFKNDIDNKINNYKLEYLDSIEQDFQILHSADLDNKALLVERAYHDSQKAQKKYVDELQGKKGNSSGLSGNGAVATKLGLIAETSLKKYLQQELELQNIQASKELNLNDKLDQASVDFNADGLLIKIKALNELIDEDSNLKKVYILFTCFIFMLEFIVVIVKTTSKKSVDEEIESFKDYSTLLKMNQYKKLLQSIDQAIANLPQITKANILLETTRPRY
ncbi:DUF4407 domain-containing protein [Maribacter sp.]|uniref:DUF4407 domain-containing protein n=1 Tax=Maribacter sp. TaxID=1897614 RepID=UPI00329A247C